MACAARNRRCSSTTLASSTSYLILIVPLVQPLYSAHWIHCSGQVHEVREDFVLAQSVDALDDDVWGWVGGDGLRVEGVVSLPGEHGRDAWAPRPVSYTHLRAHETRHDLVCRL